MAASGQNMEKTSASNRLLRILQHQVKKDCERRKKNKVG